MRYEHRLRHDMKLRAHALGAAGLLALLAAPKASAADYPWCYIDQTMSGSTYCAFTTLAQCRENAGGNGGFCVKNPSWHGPPAADTQRGPRR
jgi:hypothetical protein